MPINSPAGYETRWKPGQSGNPKGRPRGRNLFSEIVQQVMSEVVTMPGRDDGVVRQFTKIEWLVRLVYEYAEKGNTVCARLLLNEMKRVSEVEAEEDAVAAQQDQYERMRAVRESLKAKIAAFKETHKEELAAAAAQLEAEEAERRAKP